MAMKQYKETIAFINYMLSFYGRGQIYDMNMTPTEALLGLSARLLSNPSVEFCGDTLDRERVRDIILAWREHINNI